MALHQIRAEHPKDPSKVIVWNTNPPPKERRDDTLMLMTKCGQVLRGKWSGHIGEHFTMWAEL